MVAEGTVSSVGRRRSIHNRLAPRVPRMICRASGRQNDLDGRFCGACGAALDAFGRTNAPLLHLPHTDPA